MSVSTLSMYIKKLNSILIEIWTKIMRVPPVNNLEWTQYTFTECKIGCGWDVKKEADQL